MLSRGAASSFLLEETQDVKLLSLAGPDFSPPHRGPYRVPWAPRVTL